MKKFPGVYAWTEEYNNDATAGWNKDLVILEKGEPIPTIKKYNVQNKNCNLSNSDNGASGTFTMEDEDEDSTVVLADGSSIKDAESKDDITAAIVAAITDAKSRRRLEGQEL